MNIMLVLAHPNEGSFNHAIAEAVRAALSSDGHMVWFHDLYREGYDPALPTEELSRGCELTGQTREHCEQLPDADGLVIVHPNWWGAPPAMMKGWIDRTFRAGMAYRFEETSAGVGVPVGMLKAESALILNTSNTPHTAEWGVGADPLETFWRDTVLGMCGVNHVRRCLYAPVIASDVQRRAGWLDDARKTAQTLFAPVGAAIR